MPAISVACGTESTSHQLTRLVSELAARQHGVASRRQLVAAGISDSCIRRWIQRSFLHRVHRGVYAVGHARLTFPARCMAAVLAVGDDGHVTGAAAAWLRGAVRTPPQRIDVVTTARRHLRVRDVRVSQTRSLPVSERAVLDGIPVTAVARMLVDLARDMVTTELADVMHELEYLDMFDVRSLRRCIRRHRTRRGPTCRRISHALTLHRSDSAGTQSRLERRAIDRLLEGGAPMPEITPLLVLGRRRMRPGLYYRARRLVIEIDGTPHDRQRTRNDDIIKTELLERDGIRVRRIGYRTWRHDVDAILREEFGCRTPGPS